MNQQRRTRVLVFSAVAIVCLAIGLAWEPLYNLVMVKAVPYADESEGYVVRGWTWINRWTDETVKGEYYYVFKLSDIGGAKIPNGFKSHDIVYLADRALVTRWGPDGKLMEQYEIPQYLPKELTTAPRWGYQDQTHPTMPIELADDKAWANLMLER